MEGAMESARDLSSTPSPSGGRSGRRSRPAEPEGEPEGDAVARDVDGEAREVGAREGARAPRRRAKRVRSPHPGVVLLKREWTRPDGSTGTAWRAKWTDPDSKQVRFETLEAVAARTHETRLAWARKKSEALGVRRADLAAGAVAHTETTLADAIRLYLEHSTNTKRPSTVALARQALARFQAWADKRGLTSTDDVRPHDLASFREALAGARRSAPVKKGTRGERRSTGARLAPRTVNAYMEAVQAACNHLRRIGLLPHVTSGEQLTEALRAVRVPDEQVEVLNAIEVRRLLRACLAHDDERFDVTREENAGLLPRGSTPRYTSVAPFALFLLLSGARIDEALRIEWRDVDLEAADDHGKAVGAVRVRSEVAKGARERVIGLEVSPGLRQMLRAMKLRAGGASASGRVFADLTEPTTKATRPRLVALGAPDFTWHVLRRTCGTFLVCSPSIYGAAAVFLAARQLGHSVDVAQKHYLARVRGIPHGLTSLDAVLGIEPLIARVVRRVLGEPDERVEAKHVPDKPAEASA